MFSKMGKKKESYGELCPPSVPWKIDKNIFTNNECECILERALGSDNKGILLDFSVYKETSLIGFRGDYYILQLNYITEASLTAVTNALKLLLKVMPIRTKNFTRFLDEAQIFEKEHLIYTNVLPELKLISPTKWCLDYYFIKENIIVFENAEYLNYFHGQYEAFINRNKMKSLLKGLASMHASSVAFEINNKVWMHIEFKEPLLELTISPFIDYWTIGMQTIQKIALMHPSYQNTMHHNFINYKMMERMESVYQMIRPSRKYFNVFCHGDPWGGNLFFSKMEQANSAIFFDFQTCRYAPPALDVVFALYVNLPPRQRKDLMSPYIGWYYECLAREMQILGFDLQDIMPLRIFLKSCDDLKLCAALYNCIAAITYHIPDNFLQKLKRYKPNEYEIYADFERESYIRKFMKLHKPYGEHVMDSITDLMDLLLSMAS